MLISFVALQPIHCPFRCSCTYSSTCCWNLLESLCTDLISSSCAYAPAECPNSLTVRFALCLEVDSFMIFNIYPIMVCAIVLIILIVVLVIVLIYVQRQGALLCGFKVLLGPNRRLLRRDRTTLQNLGISKPFDELLVQNCAECTVGCSTPSCDICVTDSNCCWDQVIRCCASIELRSLCHSVKL